MPETTPLDPEHAFQRIQQAHNTARREVNINGLRAQHPTILKLKPKKREEIEKASDDYAIEQLTEAFALFNQTRLDILKVFLAEFGDRDLPEILDLYSGWSYIPLSLLVGGKTKKIHLVDANEFIPFERMRQLLEQPTGSINYIKTIIETSSNPFLLPPTRDVTLLDTGLSLPKEFRAPNNPPFHETKHLSSLHIENTDAKDDHLLKVTLNQLGNKPRRMYIIDKPQNATADSIADKVQARISGVFARTRATWNIKKFKVIPETNLLCMEIGT